MFKHWRTLVLLLSLGLATKALWIPAKAELAQLLIADAWQQTLSQGGEHRPWPWADTWPVARLQWPAGNIDQWVLAGSFGSSLAFGPGLSRSPGVHGPATVIAGHRDTHFGFLQKLQRGDRLRLQGRDGSWQHYRVSQLAVRDSSRDLLQLYPGQLTLVTCYPFASLQSGPLRYVVRLIKV